MPRFIRCDEIEEITDMYIHPDLEVGEYRVVCKATGWICDHETIVCYVVYHNGKLYRCYIH